MKMLMFDFRESEKDYFNKNNLPDFEIEFVKEPLNELSQLSENQLNETDAISVFITSKVTEEVIKKFKNLRIIATRSTGYNHIDLEYCIKNNIAVFNVGEYGKSSVAQFTFMLILSLIRKIIPAYLDMQKNLMNHECYEGRNLETLTIGIIGCGSIGSSVAKIAHIFGMKVYICSFEKDSEISKFGNYCELDELLKNSDIVTLHLPYKGENYHIINDENLNKMKQGAYLINTARGELVDIIAVYNNLVSGHLGGAALDTIECENFAINDAPIDTSTSHSQCLTKALAVQKLLGMKNVIITPHIAYNTKESVDKLLSSTFNSIRDYTKGLHTNQLR